MDLFAPAVVTPFVTNVTTFENGGYKEPIVDDFRGRIMATKLIRPDQEEYDYNLQFVRTVAHRGDVTEVLNSLDRAYFLATARYFGMDDGIAYTYYEFATTREMYVHLELFIDGVPNDVLESVELPNDFTMSEEA